MHSLVTAQVPPVSLAYLRTHSTVSCLCDYGKNVFVPSVRSRAGIQRILYANNVSHGIWYVDLRLKDASGAFIRDVFVSGKSLEGLLDAVFVHREILAECQKRLKSVCLELPRG